MKLPLFCWKRTLRSLGYKATQSSSTSSAQANSRSRRQANQIARSSYEMLEPRQLLAGDGAIHVVDSWFDRSFQYNHDGQSEGSFRINESRSSRGTAITEDGQFQVVVDGNRNVYVFDLANQSLAGQWRAQGLRSPQGITVDGNDLLIVDEARDRVFRYQDAVQRRQGHQSPTSSFRLRNSNRRPAGITTDGNQVWVVDRTRDRVYVYGIDGQWLGNWRLDSANRRATGIVVDPDGGESIWVVDEQDNRVYKYDQGKTYRNGYRQADSSFRLRTYNWYAQGIAIAPTDQTGPPAPPTIESITEDTGSNPLDGVTRDPTLTFHGSGEPGASLTLSMTEPELQTLGTTTVTADGTWLVEVPTELDAGEYLLTAVASNRFGDSTASDGFRLVVDVVAPETPLIQSIDQDLGQTDNDGVTADSTLLIAGMAEPGTELLLSEATLGTFPTVIVDASGNWQVDLTAEVLPDGTYRFSAEAIDLAGNRSSVSEPFVVIVDTQAPAAPILESIGIDTGRSDQDRITRRTEQTLHGFAEAGASIQVMVKLGSATETIAETIADANGLWSVEVSLSEGTHSIIARASDLAGNESQASAPLVVIVDTSDPLPPQLLGVSEDTSFDDGVTSDTRIEVFGRAEPLAIVSLMETTLGSLGSVVANVNGDWVLDLSDRELVDRNYAFVATAEDIAGHVSAPSATLEITIDSIAPAAPSIHLVQQDTGFDPADGITRDNSLNFTGMAEPGSRVVLRDQTQGQLGEGIADASGIWSVDATDQELVDGEYRLTATATDLAGNRSLSSPLFQLVVDTLAPLAPTIESIDADTGDPTDGVTSDETLIFRGTGEPGATVELSESVIGLIGSTQVDPAGEWTLDATGDPLVNGSYQFVAMAIDVAGNVSSTSEPFDVVIDNALPDQPSIVLIETDTGVSPLDGITNDATLVLTGMGPVSSVIEVYENGLGLFGETATDASGAWVLDATGVSLSHGVYEFTAIAEDVAGNRSPVSQALTVVVDTLAPIDATMTGFSADSGSSDQDGVTLDSTPVFFGTSEPESFVSLVEQSLGELAVVQADAAGQWQISIDSALADGEYGFRVIASDLAGNVANASNRITLVVDTVAPDVPSVIAISEDTGFSETDRVTSDTGLIVSGIASAGVMIELSESSSNLLRMTEVQADGIWSIDLGDLTLGDGTYEFQARSLDIAGNRSENSVPLAVTVDTQAPAQPTLELDPLNDSLPIGDAQTLDAVVQLLGTSEPGASARLVELDVTREIAADGTFAFAGVELALGENTFSVVTSDLAGNEATQTLTLVRLTPIENRPVVVAQLLNDTGSSDRDTYTTDPTLVGQIQYEDPVTAVLQLEVEGPTGIETIERPFTSQLQPDGSFEIDEAFLASMFETGEFRFGFYRYTIVVTDQAQPERIGVHHGEMFYVPPGGDSPPLAVGIGLLNDTGPVATDRLSTDPTLTGFVDGSNLQSVEFYYDSADTERFADITDQVDANGNFLLEQAFLESVIGGPLAYGRHEYHLVAMDADGNFAFKYSDFGFLQSDTDDIVPPELTLELTDDTGVSSTDRITRDLGIAGIAIDDSELTLSVFVFNVDTFDEFGAEITDFLQSDGTYSLTQSDLEQLAGAPMANGFYQVEVVAADRYTRSSAGLGVQYDRSTIGPPTIQRIATDTGVSQSDGVTRDSQFIIEGLANPEAVVELSESGLGVLGTVQADAFGAWRFELAGPGLVDGDYSFTATAQTLAGTASQPSSPYAVTLDTDSPLTARFRIDAAFDTGDPDDGYTTLGSVSIVGRTSPGADVLWKHDARTTVADANGQFRFDNVSLEQGNHLYAIETSDEAGNIQISRQRLTYDQPVTLSDTSFIEQVSRVLSIGSTEEAGTIRFHVDQRLTGDGPGLEDTFLVYVYDPDDPSTTLIDRGVKGTSAFSLTGGQAEFIPGAVRFDGSVVEIDVSALATQEVQLVFQLINHRPEVTTQIVVTELGVYGEPQNRSSPTTLPPWEVDPGLALDIDALTSSNSLEVEVQNVRYDATSNAYTASISVANTGVDLGRSIAILFEDLPDDVTLLNRSGVNAAGDPYVSLRDAIPTYGLLSGQSTDRVQVRFTAPTTAPFLNLPRVVDGGPAIAPVIDSIDELSLMPGQVLELQLSSGDASDVYYTLNQDGSLPDMTLQADGRLTIAPKPGQTGSYSFEVLATDGIRSSAETIVLDVVEDVDTSSRISGVIMDTLQKPLAGIPVELGGVEVLTAADGTFELAFAGALPVNDALRVHGEAFVGDEVYPFVAEKLPLLFGHEPFENINNVIVRPIYLPALDLANGVSIDPATDVTVTTTAIPGASVFVAAGSLESQDGGMFTGELSITEVPAEFTPAALPSDLFPDMVVTIQPGEMVFTSPAPLNLPNLSGYPSGTEMTLWSINPITGLFDDVGVGIVSADGATIETVSGGIRNSSWHMFTAPPNQPVPANENPKNEDKECDPCASKSSPNHAKQPEPDFGPAENHFYDDQDPYRLQRRKARSSNNPSGDQTHQRTQLDAIRNGNSRADRRRGEESLGGSASSTSGSDSGASSISNRSTANRSTAASRGGFGTGWGTGGSLILGNQGDFGPYGSWDFSDKSTVSTGLNVISDSEPVSDTAIDPSYETTVALHSGALHKTHEIVGYQSLGRWRGLQLHYDSERADPRPIVSTAIQNLTPAQETTLVTKLVISRGTMQMTVTGYEGTAPGLTGGEHFFPIPADATSVDASLQADMRHLPSGVYSYQSISRIGRGVQFAGASQTTSGQLLHVSSRDSQFGVGWGLAGWTELVENPDGSVLMIDGDGGERLFQAPVNVGDPYRSPAEDFTTLVQLPNGRFQRTHTNQTVDLYSPTHKLASTTDRNGNQTQFIYDANDRLSSIVDPVGLVTEFRYDQGRVAEIEDPAGRITKLSYAGGNLVSIEDPDASTKTYQYDSAHRLVGETDKRGFHESVELHFSGRVEAVTRKDGSRTQYAPVQIANLIRPDLTRDPSNVIEAASYQGTAVADRVDANGNVTRLNLDQAGQLLNSRDGQGNLPEISRNENNLVERQIDGRGHVTILEYDDRGNVTLVSDEVARQTRETIPFAGEVQSVTAIDVNGDGLLDVAVAEPEQNVIAVSVNLGDNTFGVPIEFAAGLFPSNLEAGDLNGDGMADLVVTSLPDQSLTVLYNDGFGFFDIGFSIAVPDPTSIEMADLDGDGGIDMVVGGHRQYSTLFNNGDETFTRTTTNLDSQTGRNQVSVVDLNGDGIFDLALGAPEFAANTNQVEIHLGQGDGTFSASSTIDVQGGTDDLVDWFLTDLSAIDLDRDGAIDLVATTPYTNDTITSNVAVMFGNGDGTFESAQGLTSGLSPQSVEAGDFNGDGWIDLITVSAQTGTATITYGAADRGVGLSIEFQADAGAREVFVADFNNDGRDDFAVANKTAQTATVHFPQSLGKTFEYDPVFNQLTRTVDEEGRVILYDIDPANGNTRSITEVIGELGGGDDVITSFTYTPAGLVESMTDPLGRVTFYQYDVRGLLTRVTVAQGTTDEASIEYTYDDAGNQTAITDELGHRTEFIHDALNRVVRIVEADPDGEGPLSAPVTINEYDSQGNLVLVTDAEGKRTQFVYDPQNRLIETIDALDQSITHQYDSAGNLSATVDRLGRRTEFRYDQRNRLVETINAAGGKTLQTYDADNNLISITDENGNQTRFEYDSRNRRLATINALGGRVAYEYDLVDNLIATTDELGRTTEMVYDELDRWVVTRGPDPDGTGPESRPTSSATYDAASNLIESVDALGNRTLRQYDHRDRLIQVSDPDPDGSGPLVSPVTRYTFDEASRMTSVVDPLGREVQFVYDDLNRLIREIHPDPDGAGPELNPVVRYTYDAVDNRISSQDALGNLTTFTFDDLHRMTSTIGPDPDAAGPLQAPVVTTVFDFEGQVLEKVDPLGRTTSYEYDPLGRVIRTVRPDPDGVGPLKSPELTYQYDAAGNEILVTDALGNSTSREFDSLNRLIKTIEADPDGESGPAENRVTRYRYDDAHQLVAQVDGLQRNRQFVYDNLGRLVNEYLPDPDGSGPSSAPVMTYRYDLVGNQTAVIDALGNLTESIFDNLYRVVQVVEADPDGAGPDGQPVTTYVYDVASQLVTSTDPLSRTTRFVYDDLGRVVQQILPDPDGTGPDLSPVMSFTYDLVGNPLQVTDALGNSTIHVYDDLYRLIETIEADPDDAGPLESPLTRYRYDVSSQLTSTVDALGRVTTTEYDGLGRVVRVTRPDPDGPGPAAAPTTEFTYDAMDNRLSATDALGNRTDFEYDQLYRLTSVIQPDPDDLGPQVRPTITMEYDAVDQLIATTDPLGRQTSNEYDQLGRLIRQVLPDPDGTGPLAMPTVTFAYDLMGNQTSMTDAVGSRTVFEFDSLYRRIRVIEADPDGTGPLVAPVSLMAYDLADQLLSSTDELNRTTTYEYDDLGRMIRMYQPDPDENGPMLAPEYTHQYDAMGNPRSTIDALGFEMSYEYDNLYRVTRELGEDLDGTGPLQQPITEYSYDGVDNLLSRTDSDGNRTEFAYDHLDRVFEEAIELGVGNRVARTYEYDLEDNLIRKTDRNGRITEYHRDRLYRTTVEQWLDEANNLVHELQFKFDEASQLLRAEDLTVGSRYDYVYDDLGRVVSTLVHNGGPEISFASTYDAQNRRLTHAATVAANHDFFNRYAYDSIHRMVGLEQSGVPGGATVADKSFVFRYNAADQLQQVERFNGLQQEAANLVAKTTYDYDGIGRLSHLDHENQVALFSGYRFDYDALSRLTQIDHSVDGVSQYQYDREDQLIAANHATQPDESYQFDEEGNRIGGSESTSLHHRITEDGAFAYEYDSEGNLIRRTHLVTGEIREFNWDHRNRLIGVVDRSSIGGIATQAIEHRYDVFNRWISKQVDRDGEGSDPSVTTHYEYDGSQIVLAMNDAGSVIDRYVWGPNVDQLLADEQSGNQVYWTITDHLGSIREIVDSNGTVANQLVYDSFGNVTSQTDASVEVLFGYTGRAFESNTGLQNNWNRWYDASLGRWLSEDPIGFAADDNNLYRYVGNSPINATDPNGLVDKTILGLIKRNGGAALQNNRFATHFEAAENDIRRNSLVYNQAAELEQFERHYGLYALRQNMAMSLEKARLAADVYKFRNEGARVENTSYISRGAYDVSIVGFQAGLYQHIETCKYVLVFRGTDDAADWVQNVQQGLGLKTTQFEFAMALGRAAVEHFGAENVSFVGHSLGGGLATAAAVATNRPAFVVDPSGLHRFTASRHGLDISSADQLVTGIRLWGEFLTTTENAIPEFIMPDAKGRILTIPTDKSLSLVFSGESKKSLASTYIGNHGSDLMVEYLERIVERLDYRIATE